MYRAGVGKSIKMVKETGTSEIVAME